MTPPARLIHQHQRDLTTVLVVGGTPRRRLQVAFAFHRGSRSRRGAFVCMTGAHGAPRLIESLRAWLLSPVPCAEAGPIAAAAGGTLFVDRLTALSPMAQRLLRAFVERCVNAPGREEAWSGRLVVGVPAWVTSALAGGRVPRDLFDLVDKVRVDLPLRGGWMPAAAIPGTEGVGS